MSGTYVVIGIGVVAYLLLICVIIWALLRHKAYFDRWDKAYKKALPAPAMYSLVDSLNLYAEGLTPEQAVEKRCDM